uniref:PREDICTED: copia proteinlike putative n=1 Tax=Albugo laibachii Nc14 TaxID=890382 RepID=F0X0G2_9STRA|nr:PREDICTED: copia proteinlike putative [Albugo laibachii Nc14]|eukprot:CCA27251.1 PREDICTED: copia proteinlike putative [Albugo laibachii Nc14]
MKAKFYPNVKIFEDKRSTTAIANNDGYQSRAKHIDVRYHFVRDQVKEGKLQLEYVDSKEQVADFLTKPLSTKQFDKLVRQANIKNFLPRGAL